MQIIEMDPRSVDSSTSQRQPQGCSQEVKIGVSMGTDSNHQTYMINELDDITTHISSVSSCKAPAHEQILL